MTAPGRQGFCTGCGAPLAPNAAFCTKCGRPRRHGGHTGPAPAVAQLAGVSAAVAALPWQTVTGSQRADIPAMLQATAVPAAQQLLRSSLRKPGVAMAVTTALDVAITLISGGPAVLPRLLPRLLTGVATTVLSLVTGSKGGTLRTITGVVSALSSLVALITAAWGLIAGIATHTPFLTLLPAAIGTISLLVMATKTAWMAFRG